MTTRSPACRARHLKQLLASAARLPADQAARVRASLDPRQLQEVEDSSGLEWLPVELSVVLARAFHDVLGESGSRKFHRSHFFGVFRGPVYGAVVQGAAALFGGDPNRWIRLLPDSWTLTFRDCGTWTVERSAPGVVALRLGELPSSCVSSRIWPLAVASSVSATFDVAGSEGSIALVSVSPEHHEARFEMRWTT
jgi:hypothetical protein